jgi:cell division septation protein DedD
VADSELLLYTLLAGIAIAVALVTLYVTRMRKPKKAPLPEASIAPAEAWARRFSVSTERTVSKDEAQEAKDKLKMLDLEREVLSSAIRRLYEAQAEGKISEEEREGIAQRYKSRMMKVRDSISKSESVVALHELESMQEDLIKLFSERFDELGRKVEELRTRLEIKAEKEEATPLTVVTETSAADTPEKEKEKEKRKPRKKPAQAPTPKSDAEKRIEEIRTEVEKVLERLGQIEVEGES